MGVFTVAGHRFELSSTAVERCVAQLAPEPLHEYYVVIGGHRYPPTQVLAWATGLPRSEFTSHQARRVLRNLGFTCARRFAVGDLQARAAEHGYRPDDRHGSALAPYVGKWVALDSPTDVITWADTPQGVLRWLSKHNRVARYGMLRVPRSADETLGANAG